MNYGQVKHATMQLVFSDTVAGDDITPSYNNQADYLKAIPMLVNDCMMYIATSVKKIPELVPLSSLTKADFGAFDMYTLPANCWRLMNGGLVWPTTNDIGQPVFTRFHGYKMYANNKLLIQKNTPSIDQMMVEYYRYPIALDDSPDDTTELDNTPETHSIIPYYVAAHLVVYDDYFRYSVLWNEFETRLGRITEPVFTESEQVQDVYGFGYENFW
jgi:hypothetical protein